MLKTPRAAAAPTPLSARARCASAVLDLPLLDALPATTAMGTPAHRSSPLRFATLGLLCAPAAAQVFVDTPAKIPANGGYTENVDFADVDGDGDFDAALAEGGDTGNDQNNLWINRGFEAGGTIGFFADRTATQFPPILDSSRDVEFADIDGDGDFDLHISNHASSTNQPCRWWVNMGGAQGGTQGFFQDQTAARWAALNVAPTSLPAFQLLAGGGFIDWVGDSDFGDVDNDRDVDLVHSSYGPGFSGRLPTRLFLNDGDGVFREFNPSGFRLSSLEIQDGNPALWAQGTQLADTTNNAGASADVASAALDIDLADIDGDLDLDLLHGARGQPTRMFRNRLVENGGVLTSLTDVTTAAFAPGWTVGSNHYEQEMGDCDNDSDVDIYCVSWVQVSHTTLSNGSAGTFVFNQTMPGPGSVAKEADFLDFDNDGDVDVYVTGDLGQHRLYRNDFSGAGFSHSNVTATDLPSATNRGLDADGADLDNDGDTDLVVANDANEPEYCFTNQSSAPDTHAPRASNLEQAPDRAVGLDPTVVRVQVYDNSAYYETWYIDVVLEYRVAPSGFASTTMHASQGQIWRGEIPGQIAGLVEYRVRATDRNGNVGVSVLKDFTASGPGGLAYCTAGTTTNGCLATMSAAGVPSIGATSGFVLVSSNLEGQRAGIHFYGVSGRAQTIWNGGTSRVCVRSPVQRMASSNSGGTPGACDGLRADDWLAYLSTHPGSLGQPFAAGVTVNAQSWFRDPPAPGGTNLSDGFEFVTLP
jgi:hypothetical protein